MRPYHYILIGAALAVLVCGFIFEDYRRKNEPTEVIKEKVDTLYVRDTITLSKPIFVDRHVLDSVLVPATDTLRIQDTLYVFMEREQITWQDSLSVIYASGIRPEIDSVKHFVQEKIITKEIHVAVQKKTRWGLGVQAGYGVGKDGMSPYIGVGVSYNLLSW